MSPVLPEAIRSLKCCKARLRLLAVAVVLVLFGGLMSGLTLGLMSLDSVQLEVLKRTGTPVEKERAARIMPVRRGT